jgi:L-ectoine synthase
MISCLRTCVACFAAIFLCFSVASTPALAENPRNIPLSLVQFHPFQNTPVLGTIVRSLDDIENTDRDVKAETFNSRRLLLKRDGLGNSVHDTIIYPGTETLIWYKHHQESCYCIEGEGEIQTLADGKIYPIRPKTIYALDNHERHYLRAKTKMRLICVFNPPLVGPEVHDKEGVYPPDNS